MRTLHVLLLSLAAFEGHAAVKMVRPRIIATAPTVIREMTSGKSDGGCTTFYGATLDCQCRQHGNGWRIHATARLEPYVHIADFRYLEHELLHIRDFHVYLAEHVKALRSQALLTRAACEERAAAASGGFHETMKRVAGLSAARRDGHRFSSEDHFIVVKAKVVPELVDDGLTDLTHCFAPVAGHAKDRAAEESDLVGKGGEHVEGAFRQGDSAVDP
jgi:hypothetical protein